MVSPCVVCGEEKRRHSHLGADACRACAEFYRRTRISGRKFVCRLGDGRCIVRKHAAICRRCRFDRCKAAGMQLLPVDLALIAANALTSLPPCIELPTSTSQSSGLQVIAEAYQIFHSDRMNAELALIDSSNHEYIQLPDSNDKFVAAGMPFFNECWSIHMHLLEAFAAYCFPDMTRMRENEKELTLRNFIWQLNLYECNSLSHKVFAETTRYIPWSLTGCIDINNPDSFFSDMEGRTQEKIDVFNQMKFYSKRELAPARLLRRMELKPEEEAALLALFIFSTGYLHGHAANEYTEKRKAAIFSQLHTFYRTEMGLKVYSHRLGNLCILLAALQDSCAAMREELQVYRLLEVFDGSLDIYQPFVD